MSENWDDFSNDQGQQPQRENNTIKTLRDMHDADSNRIKALEQQLAALSAERAEMKVGELMESHGLPRKAAKLYQGEADPAAVEAWVAENKDLFGVQSASPTQTPVDDGPSVTPTQSMSQEQQDDYQRVLNAGVDGVKPGHFNDAMSALLAATTREELQEVYRRFG